MGIVSISRILLVTLGLPAITMIAMARPQTRFAIQDTTALVRGTVTDRAGLPLAGVKVVATAKVFKMDPDREILAQDSAFTSDSGKYVLPGLDLNSHFISGSETDYFLTFAKEGYRNGYSSYPDFPLLGPGDTVTYDIRLAKVLNLTVIVGKAGAPDPSADLSATGARMVLSPIPPGSRPVLRVGSVPASGEYSFQDVDAGDQSITVALDGYKPAVVRKTVSEVAPTDSIRILLEKADPDSMRTLVVNFGSRNPSQLPLTNDSMFFSTTFDSLPMNLIAILDSGVFIFHDVPGSCSSGTLTIAGFTDTAALTGPVTQKTFNLHPGLSISPSPGPRSVGGGRNREPGPVPYYFDGKSGRDYNILGQPRHISPSSKPVGKAFDAADGTLTR